MAAFKAQDAGRIPNVEFGYWEETLTAWHTQGLPKSVTTDGKAEEYFGLDGVTLFRELPIKNGLFPQFERTVLSRAEDREIITDEEGNTCEVFLSSSSIPRYIRYGLATREDWKRVRREHLDPLAEGRVGDVGAFLGEAHREGRPVLFHAGSLYGWLRNWMGVEGISIALCEDPAFVEGAATDVADCILGVLEKALQDVDYDFAVFWEDMAYKTSSLISPDLYRKMFLPQYRRITDRLHAAGIDILMLDSDGYVEDLIPCWLDVGINYIYPMEVAAGMDVVKLRKKFGKELLIGGGMDKRILAADKAGIKEMVDEKVPLMQEGGYVPGCDHAMPPDIPWENYVYYRQLLMEVSV